MTSVADVAPDLHSHLFRSSVAPIQEQQTIAPSDVALAPLEFPSQDLDQPAKDERAEISTKDLNPQISSLSGADLSSTAIQMLDGDVTDPSAVSQGEGVASSDDSQEWTEGESQEHKRVKVCLPFPLQ